MERKKKNTVRLMMRQLVQRPPKGLVHGWEKFLPALALTFLPGPSWVQLSKIYEPIPSSVYNLSKIYLRKAAEQYNNSILLYCGKNSQKR